MPIAPSRACEWCIGSTWCHLSGFYGLEELTNLRYIHIIYNLNCPESQLLAAPYLGKKGLCGIEDAQPFSGLWSCCGTPGAAAVSWFWSLHCRAPKEDILISIRTLHLRYFSSIYYFLLHHAIVDIPEIVLNRNSYDKNKIKRTLTAFTFLSASYVKRVCLKHVFLDEVIGGIATRSTVYIWIKIEKKLKMTESNEKMFINRYILNT